MSASLLSLAVLALPVGPAAASYPGPNGRIAFYEEVGGNLDVYTIRADGSDRQRLTTAAGWDREASYSADGHRLVYVRATPYTAQHWDPSGELWTMNADGRGQRRILRLPDEIYCPDFSPDGTTVAFGRVATVGNQAQATIWLLTVATGRLRRLTPTTGIRADLCPVWSPDGRTLAFAGAATTGAADLQLMTMSADGTHRRALTTPARPANAQSVLSAGETSNATAQYLADQYPDWSPDGRSLVFVRSLIRARSQTNNIWTVDASGGHLRQLTRTDDYPGPPVFAPDGSHVLSLRVESAGQPKLPDNVAGLYLMRPDGSSPQRISALRDANVSSWQP